MWTVGPSICKFMLNAVAELRTAVLRRNKVMFLWMKQLVCYHGKWIHYLVMEKSFVCFENVFNNSQL